MDNKEMENEIIKIKELNLIRHGKLALQEEYVFVY